MPKHIFVCVLAASQFIACLCACDRAHALEHYWCFTSFQPPFSHLMAMTAGCIAIGEGELVLYTIVQSCLVIYVGQFPQLDSWRNKLFLWVNQQPSVNNWDSWDSNPSGEGRVPLQATIAQGNHVLPKSDASCSRHKTPVHHFILTSGRPIILVFSYWWTSR